VGRLHRYVGFVQRDLAVALLVHVLLKSKVLN